MVAQRTYTAKVGEIEKQWLLVDAQDEVLGRLASDIAMVLMGKHRPQYTPYVDCGDFVVVINADKVAMTGQKNGCPPILPGTPVTRDCGWKVIANAKPVNLKT